MRAWSRRVARLDPSLARGHSPPAVGGEGCPKGGVRRRLRSRGSLPMSSAYSTQRSRELRRVSTPVEQRLWACLRDRRLHGLKFRRQQPLHGYIVDFYCAEHRLVVELDGAVHQDREQQSYDDYRNRQLHERGLTVLHFTNDEVEQRL